MKLDQFNYKTSYYLTTMLLTTLLQPLKYRFFCSKIKLSYPTTLTTF